ncbi:hypothetical protein ACWCYZ_09405 [Streptomyces virginiae]
MSSLAVRRVNTFGILERIRRKISSRTDLAPGAEHLSRRRDKIFTGKIGIPHLSGRVCSMSMMMKALLGESHSKYEDDK